MSGSASRCSCGGEAWSANVSAGADGLPILTTSDRSCTLPAVVNGAQFSTPRLNPALTGDALANQAREGCIEIIAMGDVIDGTALKSAITPGFGTPPCTPSVLGALARFDPQLAPPSTGLRANWTLINVPQTTTWAGEAVACAATNDGVTGTGNVVCFPQSAAPLTGADVTSYSADALCNFADGGPIVAPTSQNLPDLSIPCTAAVASPQEQANECSREIAAQETNVEDLTSTAIRASTDWVVSMPTRPYHAAVDYRGPTLVTNRGITFGDATALYFTGLGTNVSASGQSCYFAVAVNLIEGPHREGRATTLNIMPSSPTLCSLVSVLRVNGEASVSSATLHACVTRTRLPRPDSGADGVASLIGQNSEGKKRTSGSGPPIFARRESRSRSRSLRHLRGHLARTDVEARRPAAVMRHLVRSRHAHDWVGSKPVLGSKQDGAPCVRDVPAPLLCLADRLSERADQPVAVAAWQPARAVSGD